MSGVRRPTTTSRRRVGSVNTPRIPGAPSTRAWTHPKALLGTIRRFAVDPNSVLERQLGIAGVYVLSQVLFLLPGVTVLHAAPVAAGGVVIAGATAAAVTWRIGPVPPRAVMLIPLADILAVGLLRAGTGGAASVFAIMLVLPVISLGVEPGRLPMLLGGPVTVAALLLPAVYDPAAVSAAGWARLLFGTIILGLTCLSANELGRRLRSRVRAGQHLRREKEPLLAAARDDADSAAAAAELLAESEGQLAGVIVAVTEQSIIGTDRSGRIEIFNAGAERLLHVTAGDALGRPVTGFHRADELHDRGEGAGDGFAVLVAGVTAGTPRVGEWTYVTGDGAELDVQVAVTTRRSAGGNDGVDRYLFVGTDVTADREQARLKEQFVNLISHELRTPLSSIVGYLELLSDDEDHPLTPDQAGYVATIDRNANRLLRLVSDLLFTAQVESGRFQLTEQPVDLHAVVQACVDTATPAAAAGGVTVRLAACDDPATVPGDPDRLGQAVDNLLSNAIKFTPTGGRVAVTLSVVDDDDTAPVGLVSVTDTGIGIPADEMDRLFSRFFRASTADEHAIPGVGLGLSITKAIAVSHHGRLRVASTIDQGTTFTLELPLTPISDPQPPATDRRSVPTHR